MIGRAHSATQRAFVAEARARRLTPADIRVIVAIHEREGVSFTDQLARDLWCESSMVRRASMTLRHRRLLTADAGPATTTTKRGTRSRLTLTPEGRVVAISALGRARLLRDTAEAVAA